jgi:hypothetical protein
LFVLNNILVAFRFDGPVFWLIDFFDMGDRFGLTVALAIVAVMVLPIAENLLKDRYSPIGE